MVDDYNPQKNIPDELTEDIPDELEERAGEVARPGSRIREGIRSAKDWGREKVGDKAKEGLKKTGELGKKTGKKVLGKGAKEAGEAGLSAAVGAATSGAGTVPAKGAMKALDWLASQASKIAKALGVKTKKKARWLLGCFIASPFTFFILIFAIAIGYQMGPGSQKSEAQPDMTIGADVVIIQGFAFPLSCAKPNTIKISTSHHDYPANDIFAPIGTPIVVVKDGTLGTTHHTETGKGGIAFTMYSTDGQTYYYAHLSWLDPKVDKGSKVKQGQIVGKSGKTGNAQSTPPHLHFGIGDVPGSVWPRPILEHFKGKCFNDYW